MSRAARFRSDWALPIYLVVSGACLGTIGYAGWRARELRRSAVWVEARLETQARDYTATLQSRYADQEMESLRERHALLAAATLWWQVLLGCGMLFVLASFAFYIDRSIYRWSDEISEGAPPGALERHR
jgi:hypothetical protein